MSRVAESAVRQRMRIAAVVAGGVAIVLFVQDLIGNVISVMVFDSLDMSSGYDYWGYLWQGFAFGILVIVAFAVGVWISLWRLAPVARESTPTTVVLRGLAAAAAGAALVFLVHVGFNLIRPFSGVGSLFSNSFPELPWGGIVPAVNTAFQLGSSALLQQGPVVLFVVLMVWIWLGRHPSRHVVSTDTA